MPRWERTGWDGSTAIITASNQSSQSATFSSSSVSLSPVPLVAVAVSVCPFFASRAVFFNANSFFLASFASVFFSFSLLPSSMVVVLVLELVETSSRPPGLILGASSPTAKEVGICTHSDHKLPI